MRKVKINNLEKKQIPLRRLYLSLSHFEELFPQSRFEHWVPISILAHIFALYVRIFGDLVWKI